MGIYTISGNRIVVQYNTIRISLNEAKYKIKMGIGTPNVGNKIFFTNHAQFWEQNNTSAGTDEMKYCTVAERASHSHLANPMHKNCVLVHNYFLFVHGWGKKKPSMQQLTTYVNPCARRFSG